MTRAAPSASGASETALGRAQDQPGQVKETLISLIIAFVMAFVFRAFVIEAFIIPTGSMAPTLLGAHMRHQSRETGYNWPVNGPPPPGVQPGVWEPMTGERLAINPRQRAGDRILVFKYLYSIYDPKRWDVVVFKAPHEPQVNYIKRLVGLPGEQIALIDGDVFVRRTDAATVAGETGPVWGRDGWQIQRKPERVQRTVWQDVFWSDYQPLSPMFDDLAKATFRSPWRGMTTGWNIVDRTSYEYTGSGPTILAWDNQIRRITDRYPYNDMARPVEFAVCDLNLSVGIQPASGPIDAAAIIRARGHEFRAEIQGTTVRLRMGALTPPLSGTTPGPPAQWQDLAQAQMPHPLQAGRITNVEFWHVDQMLQLWVDGALVASAEYDWRPRQRVQHVLGVTLEQLDEQAARLSGSPLFDHTSYPQPGVAWEFSGPVTLHRVGLQRDIYYQPNWQGVAGQARATSPETSLVMGGDHFFVLGDNSPLSQDARSWGSPEPWVAAQLDETDGVVTRKLLIGRAFFVYFPAMVPSPWTGLPMPDFGRMRWIW